MRYGGFVRGTDLALVVLLCVGCGRLYFDPAIGDGSARTTRARSTLTLAAPTGPLAEFPLPVFLDGTRADLSLLSPDTFRAFSGATELPVEIETTGSPFVAWVLVPQISGPTTITIEYGGAPATRMPVWDASYVGVWHMSADGRDAGSNAHSATPTAVTEIPGLIGAAAEYSSTMMSCMVVRSLNGYAFQDVTLEGWLRLEDTAQTDEYYSIITRQLDDTGVDDFMVGTEPQFTAYGGVATDQNAPTRAGPMISQNAWHHIAFSYDATAQLSWLYVDGAVGASGPATGNPRASARPVFIGCGRNFTFNPIDVSDGDWIPGALDEVRMQTIARSPAWIGYEYASGLDQVITYGPVEHF